MSIMALLGGGASVGFNTGNGQADQLLQQTAGSVISGLQDSILGGLTNTFNSTLGSVFANGMDLSCWGSSNSPTKAKGRVVGDFQGFLTQFGVLTNPNTENVNAWLRRLWERIHTMRKDASDGGYAKCSRKGWELEANYYETNVPVVLNALKTGGFTVTSTGTATIQGGHPKANGKTYPTYSVVRASVSQPVDSGSTSTGGGSSTDGGKTPTKSDSGFNPLWLLALAGLM